MRDRQARGDRLLMVGGQFAVLEAGVAAHAWAYDAYKGSVICATRHGISWK